MSAGDATFHSGWTLHSAPGNPTSQMREVMTVIYFADGTRTFEPRNEEQRSDLAWMAAEIKLWRTRRKPTESACLFGLILLAHFRRTHGRITVSVRYHVDKMKQSLSIRDPIGSRVPKYLAIAREILGDIGGKYSHGDYLPSERTLRTAYAATPGTIRSALAVLNREGYVQTLPQRGTLVLGKSEVKQEIGAVVREPKADDLPNALQTIALVTPLDGYLVTMLARGVELESRRNGCRLMLCGTNTSIQARRDIAAASKCVKTSLIARLRKAGWTA